MSTLKADTIQSTGGGVATLTKQAAAKVFGGFNKDNSTKLGVATDTITDQSLNVSTALDSDVAKHTFNLTNAMSNTQFTYLGGATESNNTTCLEEDSTASAIISQTRDADSNATNDSIIGYCAVFGDLA